MTSTPSNDILIVEKLIPVKMIIFPDELFDWAQEKYIRDVPECSWLKLKTSDEQISIDFENRTRCYTSVGRSFLRLVKDQKEYHIKDFDCNYDILIKTLTLFKNAVTKAMKDEQYVSSPQPQGVNVIQRI